MTNEPVVITNKEYVDYYNKFWLEILLEAYEAGETFTIENGKITEVIIP